MEEMGGAFGYEPQLSTHLKVVETKGQRGHGAKVMQL